MQRVNLAMLKYGLAAALIGLATSVNASGQGLPMQGVFPPPGPYLSSRPVLAPEHPPVTSSSRAAPSPRGQTMPPQGINQSRGQMPMQPMYGYPQGAPRQGYRPPMPYGNAMPNRNYYPQPSPRAQPRYNGPQQGDWRW